MALGSKSKSRTPQRLSVLRRRASPSARRAGGRARIPKSRGVGQAKHPFEGVFRACDGGLVLRGAVLRAEIHGRILRKGALLKDRIELGAIISAKEHRVMAEGKGAAADQARPDQGA